MGRVYAALDRRSGQRLALKTLAVPDPLKLALLKKEARVVQGIVHPNLVVLHGLEQLGDTCVLSMELVDGVTLDRWVLRGSLAFPQAETVDLAMDAPLPPRGGAPMPPSVVDSFVVGSSVVASSPVGSSPASLPDPRPSQLVGLASIGVGELSMIGVDELSIFDGELADRSFTDSVADLGLSTVDLELPPDVPLVAEEPPDAEPIRPRNPEECDRMREALAQLALAVQALHSVGRVHRDLKPANVLVERGGRVVLLDFGLALELDVDSGKGQAIGTPGFMAPEQLRAEAVSNATDWYAFGAIVYLLLIGRPPYEADRASYSRIARGTLPRSPLGRCAPELEDLARLAWDLLQFDPELRPNAAEVLERLGADSDAEEGQGLTTTRRHAVLREWTTRSGQVLFGRDDQLVALQSALDDCRQGTTSVAAVHGASGAGTTALLDAFCEELDDTLLLRGRAYEFDSVPYAGWDALVDELADALDAMSDADVSQLLPPNITWLAELFPVLRRVRVIDEAEGEPPPEDRREHRDRSFAALGLLLSAVAHRRGLVVRLDDLHWAGADSIALVLRLMESPPEAPMLFVASWREGSRAARELERLTHSHRCVDVPMDPLSPEDASGLALHLLPRTLSDRGELADRIAVQAEGSPLLIREMALGIERGLAGADLESLIRHRVAELPEKAQALLRVVALIGRPVSVDIAADVAGCDQAALATRVLVAEDLVRSSEERGVRQLECINSRVRDAVRKVPMAGELEALHLAMAERTSGENDPEGKGRHLLAGGQADEAAPLLLEAAERALAGLAFDQAAELFALADPALQVPADRRRCALGRAQALAAMGKAQEAAEQYLAAADARDPEQLAACQWRATEQLTRAGHFVEARDLLGGVVATIGVRLTMKPLPTILRLVGQQIILRIRGTRFTPRAEADVPPELIRRLDTARFVSQGLALFAPVQASLVQAIHLRLALRSGEAGRVAMALANEAGFAAALGGANVARADRLLARSVEAGRGLDAPRLRAVQAIARSIIAFQRGQWTASQTAAERAADIVRMRCRDAAWEMGTAAIYILTTLSLQGRHARIARELPQWVRQEADRGNRYAELHLILSQPVPLSAVQDRPAQGRADVLEAWERWGGLEWGLLELYALRHLVELALYEGDAAEARRRCDELWTELSASQARYVRITTLLAHATRLRAGLLEQAAGRPAPTSQTKDLKELAGSGMLWGEAEALAARGQLKRLAWKDGDPELVAAADRFEQAGMGMHAAACRLATDDPTLQAPDLEQQAPAQWMAEQGVVDPAALTRMLLPGLRR